MQAPVLGLPHNNRKVVGVREFFFKEEIIARPKTAFNALETTIRNRMLRTLQGGCSRNYLLCFA
jgi:hypothetical protein